MRSESFWFRLTERGIKCGRESQSKNRALFCLLLSAESCSKKMITKGRELTWNGRKFIENLSTYWESCEWTDRKKGKEQYIVNKNVICLIWIRLGIILFRDSHFRNPSWFLSLQNLSCPIENQSEAKQKHYVFHLWKYALTNEKKTMTGNYLISYK